MEFKQFIKDADRRDVKETLKKLPTGHRKLVDGYKIEFQPGNCLKGDHGHVGEIDEKAKKITIAAPWNYSRDFTLLHEVGHLVWKYKLSRDEQSNWVKLLKKFKHPHEKNAEEAFCMAYANHYAKNDVDVHSHEKWDGFVSKI